MPPLPNQTNTRSPLQTIAAPELLGKHLKYILMKRVLLTWSFLCLGVWGFAQTDLLLEDFNRNRLQKQKTGMLILGGWAVGNIASGIILSKQKEGSDKYFHAMNAGWNTVNLVIAGFGYYGALKADPASFDLYQTVQEHHKFQKILLLNAGLDVGYMAGGLYLIERSKNTSKNPERLKGFGQSIILQGGFLFAFDLVNYFVHAGHNDDLKQWLSAVRFDGQSLRLVWQF